MHAAAEPDCLFERPSAVRIERDACLRKALRERGDGFDFLFAGQDAAFELEIFKAIVCMGRFGEAHDRWRCQRLVVTQAKPIDVGVQLGAIGQVGLVAIADEKR